MSKKISVFVKTKKIGDPPIDIFNIKTESMQGEWPETFGSPHDARIFLRGLEVMARMLGRSDIDIPSIPSKFNS